MGELKSMHARLRCGLFGHYNLAVRDGMLYYRYRSIQNDIINRVRLENIRPYFSITTRRDLAPVFLLFIMFLIFAGSWGAKAQTFSYSAWSLAFWTVWSVFTIAFLDAALEYGRYYTIYHGHGSFTIKKNRTTASVLAELAQVLREQRHRCRARTCETAAQRAWALAELRELRADGTLTEQEYGLAEQAILEIQTAAGFAAPGGKS